MKKIVITIIFWSIMLSAEKVKLNFVVSQQANFIHILDGMSLWDSHVNQTYLALYKKHFDFTESDSIELKNYAIARDSLGWGEETELFKWADKGFALDQVSQDKKDQYTILNTTVNHFKKKADFVKFINDRFAELPVDMIKTKGEQYLVDNLVKVENYMSVWRTDNNFARDLADLPVYIFYAPIAGSKHGGANGNGIFAEFTVNKEEIVNSDYDTILHEAIHKLTSIPSCLQNFLTDSANYDTTFTKYFKDTNLRQIDLIRIFNEEDPQGWGKPEDGMLDEIFVYFCTPIITMNWSESEIKSQAKRLRDKSKIEYARVWEAQSLLKSELMALVRNDLTKSEKKWSLIRAFYDKVYFKNVK